MQIINKENISRINLPGRMIQNGVGNDSAINSEKMTVGFATYSAESGPMEPHHHAEETVYIVNAENGYVRYGNDKSNLGERVSLEAGMLLHFPELEWHVFEYDEDGFVEILFIYGQVTNIRPEESDE